jgi:amino acid permease
MRVSKADGEKKFYLFLNYFIIIIFFATYLLTCFERGFAQKQSENDQKSTRRHVDRRQKNKYSKKSTSFLVASIAF